MRSEHGGSEGGTPGTVSTSAGRQGAAPGGQRPARIVFLVNVDWFFLSHRLPLARAARDAGMQVTVVAADTGNASRIRREGFEFVSLPLARKGTSPWRELRSFVFIARLYRRLRPDLVHQVTVKPVLYGSLAARMVGGIAVVNAISGLGYTFISSERAGLLRRLVRGLYRQALAHPRSRVIFQNPDDRALFLDAGLVRAGRTVLVRGSGVDCAEFHFVEEPEGPPVVMLPARMLWDKGVGEFVEAARLVRREHPEARFVLVGDSDDGNPTAVPVRQLEAWVADGHVEWWGHRADMPAVLAASSIVVLPSYREGLPKVLLEAAATGRAIVATAVPGCREVVRDGVNGFLVAPRDGGDLARAVLALLRSRELRSGFGRAGRSMVEREFSLEIVVQQTVSLYRDLLGDEPAVEAE
jgi:glycosyltransferase involved in cell wall biosynthesis